MRSACDYNKEALLSSLRVDGCSLIQDQRTAAVRDCTLDSNEAGAESECPTGTIEAGTVKSGCNLLIKVCW
jgi:hypothetical protein